jgi:hypothetical protein
MAERARENQEMAGRCKELATEVKAQNLCAAKAQATKPTELDIEGVHWLIAGSIIISIFLYFRYYESTLLG